MSKSRTGAWLVGSGITLPLLAAIAFFVPGAPDERRETMRPLVQLPPVTETVRGAPPAHPGHAHISNDVETLPDPRIASTLDDAGASFRAVRSVDMASKIVCGEVRRSGASYFRRFVWISEAQLLATDDGGPQFAQVAKLCHGELRMEGPQNRTMD